MRSTVRLNRKGGRGAAAALPAPGRPGLLAISLAIALALSAIGCGGEGDDRFTASHSSQGIVNSELIPDAGPPVAHPSGPPPRFEQPPPRSSSRRSKEPPGVPLEALGRELAVFRGPRVEIDELPSQLAAKVERILRVDVSTSRFARMHEGEPVHLVPSAQMVCMFTGNEAVGSCWGARSVSEGIATSTAMCGPGLPKGMVATHGIVKDGVEEVTVLRSNVPDLTVPVEGNVYIAMTSSEPPLPTHLSWVEDGERVVNETGIPPKLARRGCDLPPPEQAAPSLRK